MNRKERKGRKDFLKFVFASFASGALWADGSCGDYEEWRLI